MSNRPGWRKNAIAIRVEPVPGAMLQDAADDMLALSKRLDVGVVCKFNGVDLHAWPHFGADDMQRSYETKTRLLSGKA